MKNMIPFFSISLAFMKPEISATFFSDKVEILRISLRYYLSQFSQVIVLFHLSRKSQNKKFLEFFQLFAVFIEIEKCHLFSRFLCLACLIDITGRCFALRRITSKPNCSFNIFCTSSTDTVSSAKVR